LSKALLDTDIYSEVLKASNPTVTQNATAYRQNQGIFTLSSVTVMEIVRGFQKNQSTRRLQAFLAAVALEASDQLLPLAYVEQRPDTAGSVSSRVKVKEQPIASTDPARVFRFGEVYGLCRR
jgi:tRNA(fMet)-specific endonuclease VapC